MLRNHLFIVALGLLAVCAACGGREAKAPAANNSSNQNSSEAGVKTPPADLVRAETQAVEIAAGGAAAVEAAVRLTIAEGYHITANPATLSYQIPTQLSVEPSEGISAGQPVYPPSLMQKFAFEPQPFAVYEKEAVIKLPLRAAASASKGAHQLRVKLRVQACDDQSCYPPRNLNASIPVNVK